MQDLSTASGPEAGRDAPAPVHDDTPADETVEPVDDTAEPVDETVDHESADVEPDPIWDRIDWIACAVLLVVSLLLVGLHVRAYETLSPIDELQHVDYALKASKGEVPRRNDRVGFEAMAEAACRSVDSPGYEGPACGLDSYDPNDFQERGFNTSVSQFPIYYAITGVAARAMTWTGVVNSPVTGARMFGAVWAGAAWSVLWYVMAMFRIPRRRRGIVLALLMATPITLFHAATVNTDASLLLTGSVGLLATLKFEDGKLAPWWLVLTFVGLLFVEPTNLLIAGTAGVYLTVRLVRRADESLLRRATPIVMLAVLASVRLELTDRIRTALFPPHPVPPQGDSMSVAPMFINNRLDGGVSFSRVLEQLNAVFTPVINPYLSTPLRSQLTIAGIQLTNWLLIALMFTAAFVFARQVRDGRSAWLARVGMAAMLAAGPFYTFYYAYWSNADYPAPARFGLPLVSIVVVTAASALRTRAAVVVASGVTAAVALNTVYQLVTG